MASSQKAYYSHLVNVRACYIPFSLNLEVFPLSLGLFCRIHVLATVQKNAFPYMQMVLSLTISLNNFYAMSFSLFVNDDFLLLVNIDINISTWCLNKNKSVNLLDVLFSGCYM